MNKLINRLYKFRERINFDKNYDFNLSEIWREAFKAAKPFWIQLLVADFIFLALYSAPLWMPIVTYYFPILKSFQYLPNINNQPSTQAFYNLSHAAWPYLYAMFIVFPVYLGMNLMSLRVAYQRPINLRLLTNYLSLRWWMISLNYFIFIAIFIVPLMFFLKFFATKAIAAHALLQYRIVAITLILAVILLIPWYSMTINLVFAARQNIADAFSLSWQAVKKHPFKIYGMLLLWFFCQRLGGYTAYITDILLLPPSYLAWALVYKRIFGEQGLVE